MDYIPELKEIAAPNGGIIDNKTASTHGIPRWVLAKLCIEGHGRKFCVSEFRQSQGRRCENRANWGLKPFFTSCPGGRGGMRAAGGVNAALAAGIR